MSKSTGETISRTLRQEFESGEKYPKGWNFDWLEPHFFALTRVVLPGKKNSRLLIEMTPDQVDALIDQERADQKTTETTKHAEEKKRKNRKLKQLKANLKALQEQLESLEDKSADQERKLKKAHQGLEKASRENADLLSEHSAMAEALDEQRSMTAAEKAKHLEKDRRIRELEELSERQKAAMIAHNVNSGDKEDRSFNTSSTVLEQSITKVSSNKPLDGSYASRQ
ncbi:hypothetical protein [Pseudomonas sp. PGPR81]|uniref:hypothetical protein n=1 Tax=Pseudomonas sp. PGPR81 TaxID=2913477 RepID=UPI001EDC14C6|nr:hypothetical protein [Pseudomonas sp. PGPR81]